jgi:hypothetical protein
MPDEPPVQLSLTHSEAVVLSDYLQQLEDAGQLEPEKPTFDPAVHRALVALHGALHRQLEPAEAEAVAHAYRDLREQHRAMWQE